MPKLILNKQRYQSSMYLGKIYTEIFMANRQAFATYKQTENDYVKGMETPHGRIIILFETIIDNIDDILEKHPKTDFVSFGKCMNALKILSGSLDMENGKDIASNLLGLYEYCSNTLREYLELKDAQKLKEIQNIVSGLLEAWKQIDTKVSK